MKAERALDERAKEPIGAEDVILKITYAEGFEIERITNKTSEEVQEIMAALTKLEDKNVDSIHACLQSYGADYIPIIVSGGRNAGTPQFHDFEIDLNKREVRMMHHQSPAKQAENLINRLEYGKTAFSDEERNLIVNYAYKLNDMEKTRELAEYIYYEEAEGNQGAALAVIDAQAEIDALPDSMIGLWEMEEYGYTWKEMLPLTRERALELFDDNLPVYLLHKDGMETTVEDRKQLTGHEGIFGIEKGDWEQVKSLRAMQEELTEDSADQETQLLYGSTDKYGIYQLKDDPELRQFRFEGTEALKRMGITKYNFDGIKRENYNLIYVGELSKLQEQTQGETLEAIFEKFNIDHPEDFQGHSLSVSDIVVLHEDENNSAHFVDSFGFTEIPHFARELEGIKEQEADKEEIEIADEEKQGQTAAEPDREDEDEIIDLGEERDQVLAEMKQSLHGEQETGLAFQIADRFISIQETEGGYDYSIMGADYKEIDGGVYDNPDISIREALADIVADLKESPYDNGARGNIREKDELIPIDFDGLMEKAEEADRIEQETKVSSVVEDFKAKTEELFHEISEMNPAEIEETVKVHVQAKLEEYAIDASIVDVAVVGSRCRGLEHKGSDLDVVVELSTKEREDDLFNVFNEDGLCIGEVKVDINPITVQRTGSLETYLPKVEEYLEGVREAREKEQTEDQVETLASQIDQFSYDYDTYQYQDTVEDREAQVAAITEDIRNGNTGHLRDFLNGVISEGVEDGIADSFGQSIEPDDSEAVQMVRRAKELLEKLAEYKPLAKIEEMEEQNYNMVDNIINNGAGEKARKEQAKTEQEQPAERVSLKIRLAEKKAQVIEQGREPEKSENEKNTQREI